MHDEKILHRSILFLCFDKETTGFYIRCGKSKPNYVKISYTPGDMVIKILMLGFCDVKKKATVHIEQFPSQKVWVKVKIH